MNPLYVALAFLTGAGIAAQVLINSRLRLELGGPFWAAIGQFVVGLLLVLVIVLATRQPAPTLANAFRAPWWVWTGGVFGAAFIVVSILLTPRMGTALTLASITVGQMLAALILDHYGWLGAAVTRVTPMRATGAALLLAGIWLMRVR